jgi:hypothetical protein
MKRQEIRDLRLLLQIMKISENNSLSFCIIRLKG